MLRISSLVVVSFSMLWIAAPASAQNAYTPDVAEFDGSNSYAFPKNPSLNLTGGATIEFWVQCDWKTDPGYDPVVVSNAGSKGALYTISILGDRSGLSLQAGDKIGSVPFDFKGNHMNYVAIADFSDSVAVLVNGRVVGTLEFGFADLASGGFWVGSADGTTAPFKGAIAGLRLWGV
ncbi:MAG: LamG domain-containing protein, partial [Robiginitomaculum sp.]|nr:LamG domain-containing protein [Robiginitomaculum sp.]